MALRLFPVHTVMNRELESDGLYIEGLEYAGLCDRMGFRKMWEKERQCHPRSRFASRSRLALKSIPV